MSECNHDCQNCEENCGEECGHDCSHCDKDCNHKIEKAVPTSDTKINKVIGILSGKGGVGKSMVTSLLAVELAKKGYRVGIMDADVTGPSIQKIFGFSSQLYGDEEGIFPVESTLGIKAVSINMMLESEDEPVLWRGPILGGLIKQFYSEVHWGELDYLLIDMPPGTSDVAISILQLIPLDSLVMVTSPSKLVSMIVGKTINMAKQTDTRIVGLVENMAYVKCDECGHEIKLYDNDETEATANKYGLKVLGKLPIDPKLSNWTDNGQIECYDGDYLKDLVSEIEK